MLKTKRVYEPASASDGFRILVDRLWPRGVSKARARLDVWLKEVAPSTALRKWFGHDPERWAEFRKRYLRELHANPEALAQLKQLVKQHRAATLLFGARDEQHNEAEVLLKLLQGRR